MLLLGVGEPDWVTVPELLGTGLMDESALQSPCPSGSAAAVSHSWSLRNTFTAMLNKTSLTSGWVLLI